MPSHPLDHSPSCSLRAGESCDCDLSLPPFSDHGYGTPHPPPLEVLPQPLPGLRELRELRERSHRTLGLRLVVAWPVPKHSVDERDASDPHYSFRAAQSARIRVLLTAQVKRAQGREGAHRA